MERFAEFLCRDERESGTIETYLRSRGDLPSGRRAGRLPRNCCPPGRGAVRPGIPAGVGERHAGGGPGLGRDRLALLIETICATGIRGNEVRYITVEAAGTGVAQIAMKG